MEATAIAEAAPIEPLPAAPTDSDLRSVLAQAIAAVVQTEDALEKHKATIRRADDLVEALEARLAEAEEKIAQGKNAFAAAIAESPHAIVPSASVPLREARARHVEILDELDAAKAATTTLRAQLLDREDDISRARWTVIETRNAVVARMLERVFERTAAARRTFWRDEILLRALLFGTPTIEPTMSKTHSIEQLRLSEAAKKPLAAVRADFEEFLATTRFLGGPHVEAGQRWFHALLTDPDAQVPEA